MTDNLKAELLGLVAYEPPAQLKGRGPHTSLEDYRSFLDSSARSPLELWNAAAGKLAWTTAPSSVGEAGQWFPRGMLRLAANATFGGEDRPAVLELLPHGIETTTVGGLRSRIASAVASLRGLRLAIGERVLVALPPSLDWLAAVLACAELGLVCVPANPEKGVAHVAARCESAACRVAIAADELELPRTVTVLKVGDLRRGAAAEAGEPVPSMHPAFLLSDSAGQLFTIASAGFVVQALTAFEALFAPAGDGPVWLAAPGNYAASLALAFGALCAGRPIGLVDPARLATPDELWRFLDVARPGLLMLSARLAQTFAGAVTEPPAPEVPMPPVVAVEGEQLEPRNYNALRRVVFAGRSHLVQVLGRPEAGGFVAGPQPAVTPIRPSSVAFGAPGLDITIADHGGEPSPSGLGGLLALRQATPALALELQSAAAPIALEVKARIDHKGYLWTMGEAKVLREAPDSGVGTAELEAIMASLDDVEQVAVVRFQDQSGLPRSHAFIKPIRPGQFDVEAAKKHITETLGAAAVPASFQVVERLPYSRSGKLLRSVLRRVATGEPIGLDDASLVTDPHVVAELTRR